MRLPTILLLATASRGDLAGGVVNGADQAEVGTTPFQPVVAAAVDLQEHALAGVPVTTLTVSRRASTARCGDTGVGEDASHRGAGQENAFVLGQHLGEVVLVEADVGGRRQLDDARCHVREERVGRRTAAVAVDEGLDTASRYAARTRRSSRTEMPSSGAVSSGARSPPSTPVRMASRCCSDVVKVMLPLMRGRGQNPWTLRGGQFPWTPTLGLLTA